MEQAIDRLPNWQFDYLAGVYDWIALTRDLDEIAEIHDRDRPVRMLDLGGGTGKFLIRAIEHGLADPETSLMVDFSESMLRIAKKKGISGTVRADAHFLPLQDSRVEAVFLGDTLHHMASPSRVLKEVNRVLDKKGHLLVEEFDPSKLAGKLIQWGETLFGMRSEFMPPETLNTLMEKAGFGRTRLLEGSFRYLMEARK